MRTSALLATGLALAALSATAGCGIFGEDQPADLQVYSARHYGSEEVFKQFTEETGITVDFLGGDNAELLERIKAEGKDSPADVYMTVDAGNLWNAADQGLLQPLDSPTLDEAVPAAVPRLPGPLVRPGAARAHRALQPGQRRPSPSSTPRTPTPGWPTPSGRAGSACATPARPTPSPWSPR